MTSPARQLEAELNARLGRVVFGMEEIIRGLCLALIARGHVLIEGVPGVGKTLLARTLSGAIGGNFRRIQGTSDLMPSDITGVHVFNPQTRTFEFVRGPLFADVLLVDEINRTGPKTQSALLEAMQEGTVTIDRESYTLPEEFFVVAAQNPHEFEGTYPLPESQLDRFLLRLELGYPMPEKEGSVLRAYDGPERWVDAHALEQRDALGGALLRSAREQMAGIHVSDAVYDYVIRLATASREHPHVSLGLSTRGALSLMRCARAKAALVDQAFVTPDDIKAVAPAVVGHRLILTADARLEGIGPADVVTDVLSTVDVPRH